MKPKQSWLSSSLSSLKMRFLCTALAVFVKSHIYNLKKLTLKTYVSHSRNDRWTRRQQGITEQFVIALYSLAVLARTSGRICNPAGQWEKPLGQQVARKPSLSISQLKYAEGELGLAQLGGPNA